MNRRFRSADERGSVHKTTQRSDWRDHPLIIAIISGAGAIVFMSQVVMPIQTAYLTNKLAEIQDKADNIEKIEKQLKDAKSKLTDTQTALYAAVNVHLFSPDNPYPNGLQQIRIGDDVSKLDSVFTSKEIDKSNKTYYTINPDHPFFSHVAYYFDSDEKPPKVQTILFIAKNGMDIGKALTVKLTDSLGKPVEGKGDGEFLWKTSSGVFAYQNKPDELVILPKPYYTFIPKKN